MSKLVHIVILFLIGGTAIVQGQEWLSPQPYDNAISSYFADPLFYPWNSQAERTSYENQYYPYFGEDFFRSGTNPYQNSQEAIAAQRQSFESPFYLYFGDRFLSWGESNPVALGSYQVPIEVFPTYPFQSEFRNRSLAGLQWEPFQKNWTRTQEVVRTRSSLRVFTDGNWVTP
jgi:hypothetical protein